VTLIGGPTEATGDGIKIANATRGQANSNWVDWIPPRPPWQDRSQRAVSFNGYNFVTQAPVRPRAHASFRAVYTCLRYLSARARCGSLRALDAANDHASAAIHRRLLGRSRVGCRSSNSPPANAARGGKVMPDRAWAASGVRACVVGLAAEQALP
jgi:hypothetical protein